MHERYQNLSKEKKKGKKYGCERYKNLYEDEKEAGLSTEKHIMKW